MKESLPLTARKAQGGAGIYEAGDTELCYMKLFVTDTNRVIALTGRMITEDDLLTVYNWGREDATALPWTQGEDEGQG
jgi:hypothetical protein